MVKWYQVVSTVVHDCQSRSIIHETAHEWNQHQLPIILRVVVFVTHVLRVEDPHRTEEDWPQLTAYLSLVLTL